MISATDDSKRFQERLTELHGENSRLQHDIDDLSKQKEDALTRLNEFLLSTKIQFFTERCWSFKNLLILSKKRGFIKRCKKKNFIS